MKKDTITFFITVLSIPALLGVSAGVFGTDGTPPSAVVKTEQPAEMFPVAAVVAPAPAPAKPAATVPTKPVAPASVPVPPPVVVQALAPVVTQPTMVRTVSRSRTTRAS